MRLLFSFSVCLLLGGVTTAQQVFLKLVTPAKNSNNVTSSRQFITGTTCKGCRLYLDTTEVKVWPTGAFAAEVILRTGDTSFRLTATDARGMKTTQTLFYSYKLPEREQETTDASVAYLRIEPQGNLLLHPGDRLQLSLKTKPGAQVQLENGWALTELPVGPGVPVRGIYRGEYVVKENDNLIGFTPQPLKAMVQLPGELQLEATTRSTYARLPEQPLVVETKGKLPYLLVGLGEDRLGGTKIGYLDSLIRLRVTGKAGNKYRVQLSPYRHAYIEEQHVKVLPAGTLPPASLTGNITSRGDSAFDYVTLTLSERLPYQTYQELYPSRIVVEVFGATANTNWITQLQSARAVRQVYYRQAEDGIFRMTLELEDRQHWGHTVYYNGTNLVIRVRRRPASLDLRQLVIGVDAGHGGTNRGAAGITGVWEKDLTLLLARDVQQVLQSEGATVLMSRTTDATFDNHERYLFFRDRNPHVLLSIHLNSSGDPTRSKGIGMFYKHTGFHSLAQALLQRITGSTGLQEYGLVGNFNFLLNGYTEFPNALLETLFLSNPEEEALILDPVYRRQLALAIVSGLKDWLLLQQ